MKKINENELIKQGICPVCGAKLIFMEGCAQCIQCGWSACSIS